MRSQTAAATCASRRPASRLSVFTADTQSAADEESPAPTGTLVATATCAPGGAAFAAARQAALQQGALTLADVAFQRALKGTEEPVLGRDGQVLFYKTRYSERLMMFLLRAHLPERYAHAHRAERPDGAAPAPLAPPMAEALARLEPAAPPEPHKLVPLEELDVEVQVADMMDAKLPHYCRPVPPELPLMPLGEDFERRLEAAKLGYDIGPDGELVPDVKIRRGKRSVA